MNKTIILTVVAVLGILTVTINSNAFAQISTDTASGDQPIGTGSNCHYIHENTGVLSPCNPTAGNPPISVN